MAPHSAAGNGKVQHKLNGYSDDVAKASTHTTAQGKEHVLGDDNALTAVRIRNGR
jgi:hypothetical protein